MKCLTTKNLAGVFITSMELYLTVIPSRLLYNGFCKYMDFNNWLMTKMMSLEGSEMSAEEFGSLIDNPELTKEIYGLYLKLISEYSPDWSKKYSDRLSQRCQAVIDSDGTMRNAMYQYLYSV